jgi:hypothetical protein
MAAVFGFCVILLVVGLVWFHILRPMLEDFGIITVKSSGDAAPVVMSREQSDTPDEVPSALRQTAPQTDRPPSPPPLSRDVMLDIYKLLREYNVPRERARKVLKAAGIPIDNNLWTQAMPPTDDEPAAITPIAGRATRAQFADPDLAYQPLE